MIPKLIHQTWKTADVTHWIFKKSQTSVATYLSEHEYVFWTDKDLDDLVTLDYPQFEDRWRNLSAPIKRVDIARCLILHKHGGIYADLDFIFTGNINEVLPDEMELFSYKSKQACIRKWDFLGNALMGSSVAHPFWLSFIEHALNLPSDTPVLQHTGPLALGAYVEQLLEKPKITIFGPDIFDNEKCDEGTGKAAYGHHVRTATWQYPS